MTSVNSQIEYLKESYIGRFFVSARSLLARKLLLQNYDNFQIFNHSKFLKVLSSLFSPLGSCITNTTFLTQLLCILIILSATFSLKINIKSVANENVFIKLDDIILLFIILLALSKIKSWKATPLDLPLIIFVLVCVVSIFCGIFLNTLSHPLISVLYLLKVAQYFLIFYLFLNFMNTKRDAKIYFFFLFITAILISIYGIIEHFCRYPHHPFSYPFYYRIYERGYFYHDANHFAAYLMFMASIIFGLILFSDKKNRRMIVGLSAVFILLCLSLFWTYSRAAYLAFFISLLIMAAIRSRRAFAYTLVIAIIILVCFTPHSIVERIYSIKDALLSSNRYSSSVAYRLQQAKYAWETVKMYPLFGIGLGARERVFYENQFVMLISEIGIAGFLSFFAIILAIFRTALYLYRRTRNNLVKGFTVGYIGGLLGLLIECNTLVVFLISRIMIPFFIITALLFWLSGIQEQKNRA